MFILSFKRIDVKSNAVVWEHPKGDLKNYKNLQAIFSLGAGMEHLLVR